MKSPKQRWMILGALLALTMLAMYLAQEQADESISQAGAQQEKSPKEKDKSPSSKTAPDKKSVKKPDDKANNNTDKKPSNKSNTN